MVTKTKPLHIFKPGTWTTAAGETISFSQADLEATARAYDPKRHWAPIVKGHPQHDDPAQGWAAALSVNERGLFATPEKVKADFAEEVHNGSYGTISSRFYRPDSANNPVPGVWYLRHIGFLGAQPPSVKGLDSPEFAEDNDSVCFIEGIALQSLIHERNASIFRRVREWLIEQFGSQTADKVIPDWEIESILELARQEPEPEVIPINVNFSEEDPMNEEDKKRLAELEAENKRLLAEKAADTRKALHQANVEFAEGLVKAGRLLPAHRDVISATLDCMQSAESVEFGEGDSKQPLLDAFKGYLSATKAVDFSETATKDKAAKTTAENPLLADAKARSGAKE